jgi:aminoglycoside 3-N-acetyltransferase
VNPQSNPKHVLVESHEGIGKDSLVADLRAVGLRSGDKVNVKASLRSIGKIEGGAETLIHALLEVIGPHGTLVTDSFVSVHSPFDVAFWRNLSDEASPSYAGALANSLIGFPGAVRSSHPVQKFALLGKDASELARHHGPDSYAYEVLKRMCETDGKNLKIGTDEKVPGVGTTHVAIGLSELRQKRFRLGVRYIDDGGVTRFFWINWSGGCMDAFNQLVPLYYKHPGAVIGEGRVGRAPARLTSMSETLRVELAEISRDVSSFLRCGSEACVMCALTWESARDGLFGSVMRALRRGDFGFVRRAIKTSLLTRYSF